MIFAAVIEVRMTSSRLPGKPLLEAAGKSMLEHLVHRLQKCNNLNEIVIATTINDADIPIKSVAKTLNVNCFCGDENNVMKRVIDAADSVGADVIVEITGDCPLIDPDIVEQVIDMFKHNDADYVSNAHIRSYPDGMDVQVFKLETLRKSYSMTKEPLHLEHVSLHMRQNPDIFKHINLIAPSELYWPDLGITLDEHSDYLLIKNIIEYFHDNGNKNFNCQDIVQFLNKNEDLIKINNDVMRKGDA